MTLSALLLSIIVCPVCRGVPALDEEADELVCDRCALVYRICDGVPVMDPELARPAR